MNPTIRFRAAAGYMFGNRAIARHEFGPPLRAIVFGLDVCHHAS